MRIGILSDIHDHIRELDSALGSMRGVEALIFCGDLCSPFIVGELCGVGVVSGPIHIVFGNNDGDLFRITQNAGKKPDQVKLHGELADIELGGLRFAVNHYPNIAQSLAASGNYDVVCYGHNHAHAVDRIVAGGRDVILINPGTLMGARFDRGKREVVPSTFAILDTDADRVERYEIRAEGGQGEGRLAVSTLAT